VNNNGFIPLKPTYIHLKPTFMPLKPTYLLLLFSECRQTMVSLWLSSKFFVAAAVNMDTNNVPYVCDNDVI